MADDTGSTTEAGTEATIVVIDDEADIADAVAVRLRADGFRVVVAHDGFAGLAAVAEHDPDLVVLDVMLPGIDGLEVCRRINAEWPVPVIMLSARDDETDVLVGLGVGADDYITKPFSPRELVARVRATLRRVERDRALAAGATGSAPEHLTVDGLEVDLQRRRVRVHGEVVHLTVTEFDLLAHLSRRPGVVSSREQLLAEVWGYADGTGPRTVDSHVRELRRKIGAGRIRTVHGVGYALEEHQP
jgi:DNA-binding response OmpR family regulator